MKRPTAPLSPGPPPGKTLAARLAGMRRDAFVGRESEQALWREAVSAPDPPFALLWVHGPGGVGKTTLLARFAEIARSAGRRVLQVNAQDLRPGQSLWSLLEERLLRPAADAGQRCTALSSAPELEDAVLFIDTAELLGPDQRSLREELLPALPETCLVVLASRQAPASEWLADAGWQQLIRRMPLRNLSHTEAEALLEARGLRLEGRAPVLAKTHGHPLALVLLADVVIQAGEDAVADPENSPDVVHALVQRFVAHVPSERHEQALCVAAHARVTHEALLRDLMGGSARELYDWLSSLSFIEPVSEGIVLHELAAQVIDRGLRMRDPERYERLHLDLRRRAYQRLRATSGQQRLRWAMDFSWLHRFGPAMGELVDWSRALRLYAAPPAPADRALILEAAGRHDGAELRASVEHWLDARPEAFTVLRQSPRHAVGAIVTLAFAVEEAPEISSACHFARAAFDHARAVAPLRSGESILLQWKIDFTGLSLRYPSPLLLAFCAHSCVYWYAHPKLALSYYYVPHSALRVPSRVRAGTSCGADFLDMGRAFGHQVLPAWPEGSEHALAWRDWRLEPAEAFVERMGRIELYETGAAEAPLAPPLLVLAEDVFREAVRAALKHMRDLNALAQSPLCQTRMVMSLRELEPSKWLALAAASGEAVSSAVPSPVEALRFALVRASRNVSAISGDPTSYACLEHTYLAPAPSQDIAAEIVGLPFSTYRRRLGAAVGMVADHLWQRELEGWG